MKEKIGEQWVEVRSPATFLRELPSQDGAASKPQVDFDAYKARFDKMTAEQQTCELIKFAQRHPQVVRPI
jgi:hypothetical protein